MIMDRLPIIKEKKDVTFSNDNKLMKLHFFGDQIGYIDANFLQKEYETGRLNGAHVFAELFQIRKNSLFKQSNKISFDFIELEISIEEWNLFITFIKHGKIQDENTGVIDKLNTCI